ncbi:hypothetical protein RRG08_002299 [Elysia crispata]|uniref:Uncharacterized protein n=1 Tax=Elysia crispata TaxID=231223 RepID=A0AAE0ZCU7_9GAST|nr:hypothetical protein RRG08_002299 [Elysia crispata]
MLRRDRFDTMMCNMEVCVDLYIWTIHLGVQNTALTTLSDTEVLKRYPSASDMCRLNANNLEVRKLELMVGAWIRVMDKLLEMACVLLPWTVLCVSSS